jgi:hypothetical protein
VRRLLGALLAALVLTGCGSGQDETSIRSVMARYTDAWTTRNPTALCGLVTPATQAAFTRKRQSCTEGMGKILAGVSDHALAQFRQVRINRVWVRDADDALVQFTGGNGETRFKKVSGRWLIDGVAASG